jgi:hypothetical protein
MTLSIDRLTLHVPPMSEQDARRLAELLGDALRDWPTAPGASGRIAKLSVTATAGAQPPNTGTDDDRQASQTPETLAATIAEAVFAAALRELQ